MVPISRRKLLAASGIAAVSGCMSTAPDDRAADDTDTDTDTETETTTTTEETDPSLPEGLLRALEPLPATVDGDSPTRVTITNQSTDEERIGYPANVAGQFGLDRSAVERTATATYSDGNAVICITGSFDAGAVDASDEVASTVADGRLVAARTPSEQGGYAAWAAGLDAAETAMESDDAGLSDGDNVAAVLSPIADRVWINYLPAFPPESANSLPDEFDTETIESAAFASSRVAERTRRISYVFLFEDESAVDTAALEALVDETWGDETLSERSVERDGRRGIASVVYERPPQPNREASPDARFRVEYDAEAGEAALTHTGESVPADTLTVLVDGEPAATQWADQYDTVTEEDVLTLSVDPFTHVRVRWDDPEEDEVFDYLGNEVAASPELFEASFDRSAERLTLTYRGDQPADAEPLSVHHRSAEPGGESSDRREIAVSERHDRLSAGDEIVVDDFSMGDRAHLVVEVEGDNWSMSSSFYHFSASPPGRFSVVREDGTTHLVYYGQGHDPVVAADVNDFRVLVDGEPAATQWADRYDELAEEDRLELAAEPGDTVTVEWTGGDDPVTVAENTVAPEFELSVEETDDGKLTLTHAGGEPVAAGKLTVRFHGGSGDPVAWGEQGETVAPGDSTTVDAPEDARYVVVLYDGDHIAHAELNRNDE
ncbi:hypothetical protein [Halostella salina]|uniref:hypothetical protein n=1 Tax=Halostella salina TaxID=1547897 RepID=UPI000EF7EDAD|nr:hypothetical protein [Halostella salina]